MNNDKLLLTLKTVARGQKQPNGEPSGVSTLILNAAKEIEILNLALRTMCNMYCVADEWGGSERQKRVMESYIRCKTTAELQINTVVEK